MGAKPPTPRQAALTLLDDTLRPARSAVTRGARLGRDASAAVADAAGRTALAGLDAVLDWRYTDEAVRRVLARVESAELVQQVTDRLLADGVAEQIADRLLKGPELERVVATVMESTLLDAVLDAVVDRLPEREELWVLVDEIASSPAVTEAIGQQSLGFADQVAGQVRLRSQRADARLERAARRVLRRGEGGDG